MSYTPPEEIRKQVEAKTAEISQVIDAKGLQIDDLLTKALDFLKKFDDVQKQMQSIQDALGGLNGRITVIATDVDKLKKSGPVPVNQGVK